MRVLVVSAGMGAGHHGAADELVRRLIERGHAAERIDVLQLGRPGQGTRLTATYRFLLRRLPWVYDLAMRWWARWPGPLQTLTARGARPYERGLMEQVDRFGPDVVVSVYNLASQALGRLRAAGRLTVPVVTYVTDPGPHPYWVHPGVDRHLVLLPSTAGAMRSWGASGTEVVVPLVDPAFRADTAGQMQARQRLGIPSEAVVALVSAGSWASGGIERTVDVLAGCDGVVPVTLCGTDTGLRGRLIRRGAGLALGWIDDMASLMAAADLLIDNAGGLTCWEALAGGLPVVSYRPLPGHGRLNAEALRAAGLAAHARTDAQLRALLATFAPHGNARRLPATGTGNLFGGDPLIPVLALAATAA